MGVLAKFDEYCEPRKQVIFERYRFNNRSQMTGENVAAYLTELRVIAKNCAHETITPMCRIPVDVISSSIRSVVRHIPDQNVHFVVDIM